MLISYLCYSLLLLGENQSSSGFLNFKLLLLLFLVIKKKLYLCKLVQLAYCFIGGGEVCGVFKK